MLYCHERWAGEGYPEGLKEEEVPFASRILAVCDSINAMRSYKKYRISTSYEICRQEINKNRDIMYELKIAKCMIEKWEQIVTKLYN